MTAARPCAAPQFNLGPRRGDTRYIDGLRAVAVLVVVAHHVVRHSTAETLRPSLLAEMGWLARRAALEGSHGVDLFFVISGCCLAYAHLRRLRDVGASRFDAVEYAARRIVRIMPSYLVILTVFAWLDAGPLSGVWRFAGADGTPVRVVDILMQAAFLDRGAHFANGSFWTLAVEFRWYLAFPLLLMLYVASRRAFICLLVALVVLYSATRFHALDVATLPAFMLGIVAADLIVRPPLPSRLWLMAMGAGAVVAVAVEGSVSMPSPGMLESTSPFVQTNPGWQFAAFALVVLSAQAAILRRLLTLRLATLLGAASYAIYLVHEPLIAIAARAGNGSVLPAASGAALSVALGVAFWHCFDRHFAERSRSARLVRRVGSLLRPFFSRAGVPATFLLLRKTEPGAGPAPQWTVQPLGGEPQPDCT